MFGSVVFSSGSLCLEAIPLSVFKGKPKGIPFWRLSSRLLPDVGHAEAQVALDHDAIAEVHASEEVTGPKQAIQ